MDIEVVIAILVPIVIGGSALLVILRDKRKVETRLMVVVTMTTWTTQVYKETDMAGGWFLSWGPALRVCPPPRLYPPSPLGGSGGSAKGVRFHFQIYLQKNFPARFSQKSDYF